MRLLAIDYIQDKKNQTMRQTLFLLFVLGLLVPLTGQDAIEEKTDGMTAYEGYFDFHWDEESGKIWLEVDRFDEEFLYVNSLPAGIGSNDIGLDRNQLGDTRVVKFIRSGPKVMLVQPNYSYRAVSDNADERQSVEEAFAQSVIWGFTAEEMVDGKALIDLTPFLLRDAHGVANRLQRGGEGSYRVDASRSAIYLDRTKNFPKNSEFEAMVTLQGDPRGRYLRSVTPSAEAVTVRMHHSFVELPDDNYEPRVYDPRSGYNALSYQDYATPIDQSLVKRFIRRHRLEKKNPEAAVSEAVEPIVYYLDRGAPEPIRSALIEGASWWNQAFEAAGYKDAFQVEVLPPDADPMDVRYNVINWVHRSTRGWSYGSSVTDPRTGEIIKGHVLLGSLRVRQDFLIAQGLVDAYENGEEADPRLLQMALARLRQLSAHEVGHTIGLAHNFAASVNDRASVMDYPHPYITVDDGGEIDFSQAYDTGIGEWDKRTILYGYQDFPEGTDEKEALRDILAENNEMGLKYMSDSDARPPSGAHPDGHLWDNGASAVAELKRLSDVRETALASFDETNIPEGTPMADLERVLVPLYLAHRYQVEAVSKVLGGVNYSYAVRGDGQPTNEMVPVAAQMDALDALLMTLQPDFLALPEEVIELIPPQPIGYRRDRELFRIHTGLTFDPIGAAESSANHTISFMLNAQRLTRIVEQHARSAEHPPLTAVMEKAWRGVTLDPNASVYHQELTMMVQKLLFQHMLRLAGDRDIMQQVSAVALAQAQAFMQEMAGMVSELDANDDEDQIVRAHIMYLGQQFTRFQADPENYQLPAMPPMPDGSPIGSGGLHIGCGGFH
jgi:hypothetical protein